MLKQDVKPFVRDVLELIPRRDGNSYPQDIIERVYCYIAGDSILKTRYETLALTHGRFPVNQWIGKMVRELTGLKTIGIRLSKSGIAGRYSVLSNQE